MALTAKDNIVDRKAPELAVHASARTGQEATIAVSENVEKIRDILFGSNIREYDRRFSQMEAKIAGEGAEIREDVRKRLVSLEAYLKQELGSLTERLSAERTDRAEADEKSARDMSDMAKSADRRHRALEDQSGRVQQELNQQILEKSQELSDEIRLKIGEINEIFERRGQELRDEKVDRTALASLLSELSMRLTGELGMPQIQDMTHAASFSAR